MTHEITKKDGEFFKAMCEKIRAEYGGSEYLWRYKTGEMIEDDAQCEIHKQAQYRIILLSDEIDNRTGDKQKDLTYLAFHEVMEALIGDLRVSAGDRSATLEQIDKEAHALINRMWHVFEKFVLPRLKK